MKYKEGDKILIEGIIERIDESGKLKIKIPEISIYYGHIFISPESIFEKKDFEYEKNNS